MGEGNGFFDCPISGSWSEHKREVQEMKSDMNNINLLMTTFAGHLAHLTKLDCLERIEDKLIGAATNKEGIDPKTFILVIKVFGFAMAMLVVCIAFLLTGEHFGIIGSLHH